MVTRQNRPSRLLNLNASPQEQKAIATINATESPLLRLPPELRCRIYDHLFTSTAIHIRSVEHDDEIRSERHFKLSLCETPSDHKEIPLRYVESIKTRYKVRYPGCTIELSHNKPVVPLDIGLGLLGTCRQLYHEAVLKPFTQISFATFARMGHNYSGVQRFVDALIPTQAKAIARLRVTISNARISQTEWEDADQLIGPVPTKNTLSKLKGLTDLEIVLAPRVAEFCTDVPATFRSGLDLAFVKAPGIQSLVNMRLRSFRLTMQALFDDYRQDGSNLTFSERGEQDAMEKWLRETEMRLHFGSVLSEGGPLPEFGIVQDDEKVPLPHWATPEGIEKIYIQAEKDMQAEREAAEARLEQMIRERRRRRSRGRDFNGR